MKKNNSNIQGASPFSQTYFHGTKADLKVGDLIEVGFNSNYGQRKNAKKGLHPECLSYFFSLFLYCFEYLALSVA